MKKFKSLLSLLFVMVLMLQMVGPMAPEASAANETAVTVTALEPQYTVSGSTGLYANGGFTVTRNSDSYDIGHVLPADFTVTVTVDVNGANVTATPTVSSNSFVGTDGVTYKVTKLASGSVTRPTIKVKATEPGYYDGKYISSYELVSGSLNPGHTFSGRPEVNVNGNTAIANASGVKILNSNAVDATSMYYIAETINASRDISSAKAQLTVKAAAPRMDSNGILWCPGPETENVKLTIDGVEVYCMVTAEGSVVDNGSTVTASVSNVKVLTTNNAGVQVEVTDKVSITTETSSITKPVLTIKLNKPTYDGEKYVQNFYSYTFNPDELVVGGSVLNNANGDFAPSVNSGDIVISIKDGKAVATLNPSKVTVLTSGNVDITKGFNIVVTDGVHVKDTIHVYPNPAEKDKNGNFIHDGFSTNVGAVAPAGYWVQVVDWNISSSGAITPLNVIVWDANGVDVTEYYNVEKHTTNYDGTTSTPNTNTNTGTVTNKTKLVIMAVDADKAYNGKAFTKSQAQGVKFINGTSLLSGHSIGDGLKIQYTRRSDGFTFTDYTDVTKVGTYDKELVVLSSNVIVDSNGKDVTSQYDITAVDGILTIYKAGYVSPDTGDHSNVGLWITLLAVSAVAVAAAVVIILKKSKKA